jgi:hypothetical protein
VSASGVRRAVERRRGWPGAIITTVWWPLVGEWVGKTVSLRNRLLHPHTSGDRNVAVDTVPGSAVTMTLPNDAWNGRACRALFALGFSGPSKSLRNYCIRGRESSGLNLRDCLRLHSSRMRRPAQANAFRAAPSPNRLSSQATPDWWRRLSRER